ncbi:MAG: glutamate-cysteine ligase family protein [Desulfuromonadales bacterium]|nr:glutamate-cysteine ligase family protein [Desulfuromonadales bacterium]
MSTFTKDNLATLITDPAQLHDFLAAGAKPRDQWGVGIELEKLVIDAATGAAADYTRIGSLLERLGSAGDWEKIYEDGRIIALKGPGSSVTLEPGGQLELSGRLCSDLFCCHGDFAGHVRHATAIADELGLTFLGLGAQPFSRLEQIAWVPKSRYDIMGPYMLRCGDMGQRMMKQTAGIQVNLDYLDEADCFAKLCLAQALAPLLYSLFANAPLLDGAPSGFLSARGEIWRRTDPDRTGLLPFLFAATPGFDDYVEFALDVPMYFIRRSDHFLDMTTERFTFRRYLAEGFAGAQATLADWDLHLSTLFTEVRLRPQIEVRSMDSLPPALSMAPAALLKGLLYDAETMTAAWELCRPTSAEELQKTLQTSWREGLRTPWRSGTLRDLARECLPLARAALSRQRRCVACDEGIFLDTIEELAASGVTLAERLLADWFGDRPAKINLLKRHCGFSPEFKSLCPERCIDVPRPDCGRNFYT